MPVPDSIKAYWIPRYSDRIKPLVQTKTFPLIKEALAPFENLKKCLIDATLGIIDDEKQFTDAVKVAIFASLNQEN